MVSRYSKVTDLHFSKLSAVDDAEQFEIVLLLGGPLHRQLQIGKMPVFELQTPKIMINF